MKDETIANLINLTNELIESIETYRSTENGTLDLSMFKLLLPVAVDAGLMLEEDSSFYVFDLTGDNATRHWNWDYDDDDDCLDAMRWLNRLMREQIRSASSGQLRHYAAWVDRMVERPVT